jgi:hypothetical protein
MREEESDLPQADPNMSLKDQVFSSTWQVRRSAFQKIN